MTTIRIRNKAGEVLQEHDYCSRIKFKDGKISYKQYGRLFTIDTIAYSNTIELIVNNYKNRKKQ